MARTGYQGSTKSGVKVTVYPSLGDGTYGDAVVLSGDSIGASYPCVIAVQVQNALAQGASFSVTLKKAGYQDLIDAFPVDSWIDISFTQNGLSWHLLRGLLDEVRANHAVGGSGATMATYALVGRSFQKIYDDMNANFDPFLGDVEVSTQLLYAIKQFVGAPDVVCRAILFDILKSLGRRNRGLWAMPPHMPGIGNANTAAYSSSVGPQALFADVAKFVTTGFDLYALPRAIPARSLLTGGGALWGLAQQYSDSALCELFTELLPKSSTLAATGALDTDGTVGLSESDSTMVAILRDRPYMAVDPLIGGPLGIDSPYFNLPQFVVPLQRLAALDVGRSSYERLNAFWIAHPDAGNSAGNFPTYKRPLWDVQDQIAHGLRKMVVPTLYNFFHDIDTGATPSGQYRTIDGCVTAVKRLVRDWYCPNALFLSGSLELARGAPWIKVGCRLQVQDARNIEQPLNGYIEGVSNMWSLNGGLRTSIRFTRGFYGTEQAMLNTLRTLSARYVEPTIFGINS